MGTLHMNRCRSPMGTMTGTKQGDEVQSVDPVVIKSASVLTYWVLVGVAVVLGLIAVDVAVALALAPIALLIIEAIAARLAARVAG